MTDPATYIDVIEIRAAKNGYVVCAFFQYMDRKYSENYPTKGYATYVVENSDGKGIGQVVEQILSEHAITADAVIPPARRVP